jgi:hypothetical protein
MPRLYSEHKLGNTDKPVKAIIRHLPDNIPAEDITVALKELGYNVISAKQMTAK